MYSYKTTSITQLSIVQSTKKIVIDRIEQSVNMGGREVTTNMRGHQLREKCGVAPMVSIKDFSIGSKNR